jgi:hypothetical protein
MPRNDTDPSSSETAVVMALLGRTGPVGIAEMYAAVRARPSAVDAAIDALVASGVVAWTREGSLTASSALAHLDRLRMVDV